MDRVYIDKETGEDLIHSLCNCDICHSNNSTMINDAETGEPEVNLVDHTTISHFRRVPFQVLERYLYLFYSKELLFFYKYSNLKLVSMFYFVFLPRARARACACVRACVCMCV